MNHNQENSYKVPPILYMLIVFVLGCMYYYAEFIDTPSPEDTMQVFYKAYFNSDYHTVAQNLSVFWCAQLLPQYAAQKPSELLDNRPAIERDIQPVIRHLQEDSQIPQGLSIEILSEYTKKGKYGALVVYQFMQDDKPLNIEAAVLIKENQSFKILSFAPVDRDSLPQVQSFDIEQFDMNIKTLLKEQS